MAQIGEALRGMGVSLLLVLGACGGQSGESGDGPEEPGPTVDVTGAWYGRWRSNDAPAELDESFTLFLEQSGRSVSGTMLVPYFLIEEPVTGTVAGDQLTLSDAAGQLVFSGSFGESEAAGSFEQSATLPGTWQGYRIGQGSLSAVQSLIHQNGMSGLAYDGANLWLSSGGLISMDLAGNELATYPSAWVGALTYDGASLWGLTAAGSDVSRFGLDGTVAETVALQIDWGSVDGLVHDGSSLFGLFSDGNEFLVRIDSEGQLVDRVGAPGYARLLAHDGSSFWVLCDFVDYAYRMDGQGKVLAVYRDFDFSTIDVLDGQFGAAGDITFVDDTLWFASSVDGAIHRLASDS